MRACMEAHRSVASVRESEVAATRDAHLASCGLSVVEQVESVRSALLRTAFGIC